MDDRKIDAARRKLNRMIAKEWRQIEPELKRCIREGRYEAERYLRARAYQRQRELIREWQAWRLQQPPFMTKEDGYYMCHQVTPENEHLLMPGVGQ
jgi:hypothetical protein